MYSIEQRKYECPFVARTFTEEAIYRMEPTSGLEPLPITNRPSFAYAVVRYGSYLSVLGCFCAFRRPLVQHLVQQYDLPISHSSVTPPGTVEKITREGLFAGGRS
jgi:hypothetical protein